MLPRPLHSAVEALRADLATAREHPGEVCGLPTGLRSLDATIGGLQQEELVVLGARPGQGKTALAWQWASNIARHALAHDLDGQVAFVCGEMSAKELLRREVARQTHVPVLRQLQGDYSDYEDLAIQLALNEIQELPLAIYDRSLNLDLVQDWLIRQPGGCLLVVIDYLQLVQGDDRIPRYQVISSAIARLRSWRDQIQAPLVVLSQLNRPEPGKELDRPYASRMRDSGAIEEAANKVMLLHNTAAIPGVPPEHRVTELIVEKNRSGWVGAIDLVFQPEEVTFADRYTVATPGLGPLPTQSEPQPPPGPEREAAGIGAD